MKDFYSIITDIGLAALAKAKVANSNVSLTQLAVGDGNGAYYEPKSSQTALVNEKYRCPLNIVILDQDNDKQILIEASIANNIGGFFIREVGIFDENGDLFAVGKYPVTFKPESNDGSNKDLYIRLALNFSSTQNVEILLDPNSSVPSIKMLESNYAKKDFSNVDDETKSHNKFTNMQGGKEKQYYHLNLLEHSALLALLELLSEENSGKSITISNDGKSFVLSSSSDEIAQTMEVLEGSEIKIKSSFSIYKKAIISETTFSFDVSDIQDIGDDKVITIELFITMETAYSITMPENISWVNNVQPLMNVPAQYLIAFRSFDKGQTWIANIQARWV